MIGYSRPSILCVNRKWLVHPRETTRHIQLTQRRYICWRNVGINVTHLRGQRTTEHLLKRYVRDKSSVLQQDFLSVQRFQRWSQNLEGGGREISS